MVRRTVEALKVLAQKGGLKEHIPVKTTDLASWLGISQQSASNRLAELFKGGYIERRSGPRFNYIMLTHAGLSVLEEEYSEYKAIFEEEPRSMHFIGTAVDGIGEGKYYIEQAGYIDQFKEKLGFVPQYGTFNVKLAPPGPARLMRLMEKEGIPIKGFVSKGRTFGEGKAFKAVLLEVECAVMIPKRSHYTDVLEVISDKHLRRKFGVRPGDKVELEIKL